MSVIGLMLVENAIACHVGVKSIMWQFLHCTAVIVAASYYSLLLSFQIAAVCLKYNTNSLSVDNCPVWWHISVRWMLSMSGKKFAITFLYAKWELRCKWRIKWVNTKSKCITLPSLWAASSANAVLIVTFDSSLSWMHFDCWQFQERQHSWWWWWWWWRWWQPAESESQVQRRAGWYSEFTIVIRTLEKLSIIYCHNLGYGHGVKICVLLLFIIIIMNKYD